MFYRLALLGTTYKKRKKYYFKDILSFETKRDLEKFKNSFLHLIFRLHLTRSQNLYCASQEYYDENIKKYGIFINDKPLKPHYKPNWKTPSFDLSVTFDILAKDIENLIETGYFTCSASAFSPYAELFLKYFDKTYFLSKIFLMSPGDNLPAYTLWSSQRDASFPLAPINKEQFGRELCYPHPNHPMGAIPDYSSSLFMHGGNSLVIKNFRPDEHIAIVNKTYHNGERFFTFVPPAIIQKNLTSNGQINVSDIDHILPLPSLFSGHSGVEITNMTKKAKTFKNPCFVFQIYTERDAKNVWRDYQNASGIWKGVNKKSPATKSYSSNFFITRKEYYPLRFKYDVLNKGPFSRNIYFNENCIHLLPLSYGVPRAVSVYDILPRELQVKFSKKQYQFCWVQYNASLTVPKLAYRPRAKPGYSAFKMARLESGRIYRNLFSINALRELIVHANYGGSYFVLAVCPPEYMRRDRNAWNMSPEFWTIYVEGKPWTSLRDRGGKMVKYPYKINY